MSKQCLHCNSILYKSECLSCLKAREEEIINLFDMIDSKLFPMTYERKSLILKIVDFELEEIREKIKLIKNDL